MEHSPSNHSPSNHSPSSEAIHAAQSPILRLLLVHEQGIVFESLTPFSVGCGIELALHSQSLSHQSSPKPSSPPSPHHKPSKKTKGEVITSEGLVVSCQRRPDEGRNPVYEVTLLFSTLESRDRRKLRDLASKYRRHPHLPQESGTPDLDQPDPFLGLN